MADSSSKPPSPPRHLGVTGKKWWRSVTATWSDWSPHELELLRLAAEALDRGEEARKQLKRDGLTVTDRHGQVRRHPLVAVEADARGAFARLVRQLKLDDGQPAPPPRNQWRRPPKRTR